MIAAADVRRIALALPEAEELDHFGRPSFRVRGKIFVTLREDEGAAVLTLSESEQAALAGSEPATFSAIVWGRLRGRTRVELASVDPEEMGELIEEAWRTVAVSARSTPASERAPGSPTPRRRPRASGMR